MTSTSTTVTPSFNQPQWLVFLVLWLLGLYLRLPILVIPPLANWIQQDFTLSQTLLGSLTTLPILMLSVGALVGALAIHRLGPRNTLIFAVLLVALASAGRALAPDLALLLSATLLMGLGVAIMQPALPAVLSLWLTPQRLALGTAVYMNGMLMGEFIGAGLTLPWLMPLLDHQWRATLLVWSLPGILVAALALLPRLRQTEAAPAATTTQKSAGLSPSWLPDWSDPLLWRIGFMLAVSASLFFGTNAYMSSLLEARNEEHLLEAAFFWFNSAQMFASLFMLVMAKHWIARNWPLRISLLTCLVGLLLFLITEGALSLLFGFVLSFGAGVLLILLVALPAQLRSSAEAGRLAAGAFTLSYGLSFVLPLLGGLVADFTQQASMSLWFLLLLATAVLPLAWTLPLSAADQRQTER
ncbi:MFS transporter [Marinospirillum sp. MEB164]|uniref:MFS transporter n=1 Tax=Marinospirillum alkalitolerans TaxID=3123374 RepID=A0ABW8PTH1_9GAMM